MKRLQHLCLGLILVVSIGAFAAITPRASAANVIIHIGPEPAAPAAVTYHYVYYPEEEVYYVPETRVYWWSDGGEWRSGPAVPASITLGASVNLDVDGRDPWRHHEVIRERFPRHRDRDRDDRHDRDDKH